MSTEPPTFPPPPPPPAWPPPPPRRSRARWIVPLALLFLFFAFCGGLALLLLGALATGETVARGSILELKLHGEIPEAPDPVGALFPSLAGPPSLFEIRKALERAAADATIAGLKVDIDSLRTGWGEGQELAALIDRFRKSGKPVHAWLGGEFVGDPEYAVALAGDKVWSAPMTSFAVNGLNAEIEFWRGTLDKLHVEPQYFMRREYKSAGETFTRSELSEPGREATRAVLEDIWDGFLAAVAERRKLGVDEVRAAADLGLLTAVEAQAAKWIDAIGYPDAVEGELAREGASPYRGVSVRRYLRATQAQDLFGTGRPRLAVVFGEGPIVSTSEPSPFGEALRGPVVANAIRAAADDAQVKGILLRINSPGGSAVGSDYIWRAVEYARKEKKKPVVASMSSVAGSGGYWVAMNADAIVARPATITGSIGVVFGKLNVLGLYRLAGANVDRLQVGRNADLLSLVESFDEEQIARIEAWMDAVYGEFKSRVAAGRGLDPARVEELAKGRIWSGTDARDNGLVDRLGGYEEALAVLREKAGLAEGTAVDLVVYPRQRSFFEALLAEEDGLVRVETLRRIADPERALREALAELSRPGAWLMMPALAIR